MDRYKNLRTANAAARYRQKLNQTTFKTDQTKNCLERRARTRLRIRAGERNAVGRRAKNAPQRKRLPRRVEDGLRVVKLVAGDRRDAAKASVRIDVTAIEIEHQGC